MACTYILQLIVSLKRHRSNSAPLRLQHNLHQLSLDGAGLRGLDVNPVNSGRDYFAHICIPAIETTLYYKRI
jgi:hypothetical protein